MKTLNLLAGALAGLTCEAFAQKSTDVPDAVPAPPAATAPQPASWIVGRWVFDDAFTRSKQINSVGTPEANAGNAETATISVIDKMKGAGLIITPAEITTTLPGGAGRTQGYVIVPGTSENMVRIRQGNGEAMTFYREGDRLWMQADGAVGTPLYFRKEG